MGRHTGYKEEYVDKVDDYLKSCIDSEYTRVKTEGTSSTTYDNLIKVKLPTMGGFAKFIGVSERSVFEWANEHESFAQSLEKIKTEQKERLLNSGLAGTYNSTIAKLILSANHGMSETTKTEHSGAISLGELFDEAERRKNLSEDAE